MPRPDRADVQDERHEKIPLIAYFDTNVFDDLYKRKNPTDPDRRTLAFLVSEGRLSIVLSYLNIEEVLSAQASNPEVARGELRLLLDLADRSKFIKGQHILVTEAIRSYALGTPLEPPFEACDRAMHRFLKSLSRRRRAPNDMIRILDETHRDKEEFRRFLEQTKQRLLPLAKTIKAQGGYPFNSYLENNAGWLAEAMAETAGVLNECQARGIGGLLKIRPVSMAVGVNLSLCYAHDFEGHTPRISDSRDILHAILSANADVFVTNDRKLNGIVSRVPGEQGRITDLRGLLGRFS